MYSGDEFYGDDVTSISDSFTDLIVHCHDNHAESCSCRWSGVVILPEIVIEDHGAYVVVAEVAPDA